MGFFSAMGDFVAPALDFVTENEKLIGIGMAGASAYYAYDQQKDAIEAAERAQNASLVIQQEQTDREKAMSRLQVPNSNASQIDMFSQKARANLDDFMYEPVKLSDRSSSGINTSGIEKALGLA